MAKCVMTAFAGSKLRFFLEKKLLWVDYLGIEIYLLCKIYVMLVLWCVKKFNRGVFYLEYRWDSIGKLN